MIVPAPGPETLAVGEKNANIYEMVDFKNAANLILMSTLSAVAPESLVYRHVKNSGETLLVGQSVVSVGERPLLCLGAGKASARMAAALYHTIRHPFDDGTVVTPKGYVSGTPGCHARAAGHPVPDQRSLLAAEEALEIARKWVDRDPLVLATVSGGASALWCAPVEGLTLEQKIEAGKWLLASGLSITQVNTIRRRLSAIKGGRLAAALEGAEAHVLVLSDVPMTAKLDVVGSGPFHHDPTTNDEALAALDQSQITPPAWLVDAVKHSPPPPDPQTFTRVHHHLIGSNHDAVIAAAVRAAQLDLHPIVETEPLTGEAAVVGRNLYERASAMEINRPTCLVFGGETTVTIRDKAGKGGRNQEMALAFALAAEGNKHISLLAFTTDGIDGASLSAGAFVTGQTAGEIRRLGLDSIDHLHRHDSHTALAAADCLINTGPTGTNVADVALVFIG